MRKSEFLVRNIEKETADIITLYLEGEPFSFVAGQYVAVYLNKEDAAPAKFYTISSAPSQKLVALSVKKIGKFSGALHDLKVGDKVYISGPFGWFYPKEDVDEIVFLAAGIGVTPFLSIMKDYAEKGIKKNVNLFYTNKTFVDIGFYDELNGLASDNSNFEISYCLTREDHQCELVKRYERMDTAYLKDKLGDLSLKKYYLCGPINFVSDLRKQLLAANVKEENIFTESFF